MQTHTHTHTHTDTASLLGRPDIKELITPILFYPFSSARLPPRPCLNRMFVCLVNCLFDHLPVCLLVCTSFSFHCLVITREPCPEPHTHTHTHTHTLPPVCTLVPVLSNSLMGYDMLTKIAPFPFLNMCTSYSVIPRTSSLCLLPTLIHSQLPSTSLCSGSRRWGGGMSV